MLAIADSDGAVAVFALMFIFGGPIVAFIAWRTYAHKERMEMIRQGMVPPGVFGGQPTPMPGRQPAGQTVFVPNGTCQATLAKGIRTMFIGFALLIGLSLIGCQSDAGWHPGPWLLGGLIPFFVGLSQVVIAMLSGATIVAPGWQRQGAGIPEPPLYSVPNPPPPGAPPPPPSGPYTYRPPGDVQELPRQNPPRTL